MHNRLLQLDSLLSQTAWLWHESPFKIRRPRWCEALPDLCDAQLQLNDAEVVRLERDATALRQLLGPYIPELYQLDDLLHLPEVEHMSGLSEARFGWEVPGRKLQQVSAFASTIEPEAELLEWCGGKGHLGRVMAQRWQIPVSTLEWNNTLCNEGERLAQRLGVQQVFHRADALASTSLHLARNKHVLALHACGELHRQLIRHAGAQAMAALDIAPCCYHLGSTEHYQAFNREMQLQLSRDDVRLAVTNSDTATTAQLKQRDKEMVWKLGYIAMCEFLQSDSAYKNLQPIPKPWFKLDYSEFLQQLAQREGVELPQSVASKYWLQQGWQRQREVMRLNLVRMAFRRAIELWLVLDMAVYLQQQGYAVVLQQFCTKAISPRNILISARQ